MKCKLAALGLLGLLAAAAGAPPPPTDAGALDDDCFMCTAFQTCCEGTLEYGCCPSGYVCCEDNEHCCPAAFPVCDLEMGACTFGDELKAGRAIESVPLVKRSQH